MQLGLMTMMTVMTMPLGYPLAWGYIKISVIIVMTVTFTDKATGKPLIIGFPGAFSLYVVVCVAYWCPCPAVSNCCSRSQATASAGCSMASNTPAACSLQVSCGWQ